MTSQTISVAKAAEVLSTNKLVIERWVKEEKIPAIWSQEGYQILAQPFEQLCQELRGWLSDETPGEDRMIRSSIFDLDDFWKERS